MYNGFITWEKLKSLINTRKLRLQYEENVHKYIIYALDGSYKYWTELWKDTAKIKGIDIEQNDINLNEFETTYKATANSPITPLSDDGKTVVRAESRPLDTTTYFTMAGDTDTNIGDGKKLFWDFSNNDDITEAPEGYKKKRIEFKFLDSVYIKEGALYFHNAKKGSHVCVCIVCPTGQYYYKNDGTLALATEDTIISRYVNHHFFQGNCPMGDELNTESCSVELPNIYKFWIEVTVPDTDEDSNGYISIELYRKRTILLL